MDMHKLISLVERAGKLALRMQQEGVEEFDKDASDAIVTEADHAVEQFLRKELDSLYPEDGFLGEEGESEDIDWSGRVWVVDPIDGTRPYAYGKDYWAVCCGLCEDGVPVVGVVYCPGRDELWYAQKGEGAFYRHGSETRAITVSSVKDIARASIDVLCKKRYAFNFRSKLPETALIYHRWTVSISLVAVATGDIDALVCLYPGPSKWDSCAADAIIREAGGRLLMLDGKQLDYKREESSWGGFMASNELIEPGLLSALMSWRNP